MQLSGGRTSVENSPNREKMTDEHKYDRGHYTFRCASAIQHCYVVYLRVQELHGAYDFLTHFDLTCLEALKEDLKLYSGSIPK